jgi:hypothetical protein
MHVGWKDNMIQDESKRTVRKTVVIDPLMDSYIRKTWSILIEQGHDATYSMALNYILLIAIMAASREGSLSEGTIETLQDFVSDRNTIDRLNLQEYLGQVREHFGLGWNTFGSSLDYKRKRKLRRRAEGRNETATT